MSEYFVLNPAISDKVLDGHLLMKSYDLFPCKSVFMLIAFLCCVLQCVSFGASVRILMPPGKRAVSRTRVN